MPLPDDFLDLAKQVNNWGRWGSDDQRGTLNLVTPDVVRAAASHVVDGRRFSLALALSADGPQAGLVPGRDNPTHVMTQVHHAMTGDPSAFTVNDDRVDVGLQAATHWDALSHVGYDGRHWNGNPSSCITEAGAARCGIEHVGPLASRGVLLDLPRALGGDQLDPGHVVTAADLDAAEAHAGVTVAAGDIVLLRTGQGRHLDAGDRIAYAFPSAGPGTDAALWFHRRDIAAVATDNLTFEAFPGERDDVFLPVHLLHLVEMGLTQGQNFFLDELADACADDGRHAMLLVAAPEPVVGGVGGLVHPVAIR